MANPIEQMIWLSQLKGAWDDAKKSNSSNSTSKKESSGSALFSDLIKNNSVSAPSSDSIISKVPLLSAEIASSSNGSTANTSSSAVSVAPFNYSSFDGNSTAIQEANAKAAQYSTWNQSDALKAAAQKKADYELNNNPGEWLGGKWGETVQNAYDAYTNRDKFSYDLNGDMLYQQYKDQYMNLGNLAMQDTMGQATAMTGGYGNSYAATAGNQAYQSYLSQLNNVVPELYQLALSKYNQEGENLLNQYNMANQMYQTEYGEHRDAVNDYNNELARLTDEYYTQYGLEQNQFNADRNYWADNANNVYNREYNTWEAAYNKALDEYQLGYQKESDNYKNKLAEMQAKLEERSLADKVTAARAKIASETTFNDNSEDYQTTDGKVTTYHGKKFEGEVYITYKKYVETQLNKMYESGEIDEPTLITLMHEKGIVS